MGWTCGAVSEFGGFGGCGFVSDAVLCGSGV